MRDSRRQGGFSFLELLIVVGIIGILTAVTAGFYRNFARNVDFETIGTGLISDLKTARAKAMAGEDGRKWGIHLVNGTEDYYELFSTPSTYVDPIASVSETIFFPGTIQFTDPAEGNTKDIIFERIRGTTTAASISMMFESSTKNITVKSIGHVY